MPFKPLQNRHHATQRIQVALGIPGGLDARAWSHLNRPKLGAPNRAYLGGVLFYRCGKFGAAGFEKNARIENPYRTPNRASNHPRARFLLGRTYIFTVRSLKFQGQPFTFRAIAPRFPQLPTVKPPRRNQTPPPAGLYRATRRYLVVVVVSSIPRYAASGGALRGLWRIFACHANSAALVSGKVFANQFATISTSTAFISSSRL